MAAGREKVPLYSLLSRFAGLIPPLPALFQPQNTLLILQPIGQLSRCNCA